MGRISWAAALTAALLGTGCGKETPVESLGTTPPPRGGVSNREIVEQLRARSYDASETVPGVVVNLPDVYLFAFGSSTVGADGKAKLKELATYLVRSELSSRQVSVEGHTDSVGTNGANQTLSERRAEAVRNELLSSGVQPVRLVARGFGETRPVAPNAKADGSDDAAGRARNRRVEILIENTR